MLHVEGLASLLVCMPGPLLRFLFRKRVLQAAQCLMVGPAGDSASQDRPWNHLVVEGVFDQRAAVLAALLVVVGRTPLPLVIALIMSSSRRKVQLVKGEGTRLFALAAIIYWLAYLSIDLCED